MVWRVCRRPPPCVAAALLCLSLTLGKHQPRNEVGGGCWSSLQLGGTGLSLPGTAFIGAALPSSIPWGFHGSSLLCAAEVWHAKYQEKPPQHWVDPWRELNSSGKLAKPHLLLCKSRCPVLSAATQLVFPALIICAVLVWVLPVCCLPSWPLIPWKNRQGETTVSLVISPW